MTSVQAMSDSDRGYGPNGDGPGLQGPGFQGPGMIAPARDAWRGLGPTDDGRREDGGRTDGNNNDGPNTGVVVKTRPRTRKPAMYKVLMLNDDYTPMEFVVHVLERFFQKTREEATRIMLHVHRRGVGVCGVFTYEVAETKVTQVMDLARQNQHPLQCTIEKE
jgi:ATP-dependent Clp protease adaptor protein ClpS